MNRRMDKENIGGDDNNECDVNNENDSNDMMRTYVWAYRK